MYTLVSDMSRLSNSEYLRCYRRNHKDVANMACVSNSEDDLLSTMDMAEHYNNEIAALVNEIGDTGGIYGT